MTCRIGINPLTWTNDDMPELGGKTPLEQCLREAAAAGYAGIELGNKFPREAGRLEQVLEPHGLACVSGWYSARLLERSAEAEIKAVEAHLRLLEAVGSEVMVFAETTGAIHGDRTQNLMARPLMETGGWQSFGEKLTKVAEHLAARGVRMAYHHHVGTVVETEAEVDVLMASTGEAVGLLLDTGHLTYAGGNPVATAERHGDRLAHVHLKDVREAILSDALTEDVPFLKAVLSGVFTVPGDGSVDYPKLMGVLKKVGYGGWLVVEAEQDPKKAPPAKYARMGFEYVNEQAQAAGLLDPGE